MNNNINSNKKTNKKNNMKNKKRNNMKDKKTNGLKDNKNKRNKRTGVGAFESTRYRYHGSNEVLL